MASPYPSRVLGIHPGFLEKVQDPRGLRVVHFLIVYWTSKSSALRRLYFPHISHILVVQVICIPGRLLMERFGNLVELICSLHHTLFGNETRAAHKRYYGIK
jgi:hypothetical protein